MQIPVRMTPTMRFCLEALAFRSPQSTQGLTHQRRRVLARLAELGYVLLENDRAVLTEPGAEALATGHAYVTVAP